MLKNRILLSLVFLLIVGFFILNTPEKGFAGVAPPPVFESDCCVPHMGAECDNAQCTAIVCSQDPYCCDTEWDNKCADEALDLCFVCGGEIVENIPTLNEWGLIALAGSLGLFGLVVIRRRYALKAK